MKPELQKVYAFLVASPDRATLIEAVDELLLAFRRNPSLFVLPKVYKWATPLIEEFAYDFEGWVTFARQIVDEFPKRTEERRPLQILYRKLNMRHDAIIRRERLKRALAKYIEVHGDFESPMEARDYERMLFQYWKASREAVLVRLRLDSPDGKASAEERRDACDAYWESVRAKIDAGDVPTLAGVRKLRDDTVRILDLLKGK